jgi:hypothetical protein
MEIVSEIYGTAPKEQIFKLEEFRKEKRETKV